MTNEKPENCLYCEHYNLQSGRCKLSMNVRSTMSICEYDLEKFKPLPIERQEEINSILQDKTIDTDIRTSSFENKINELESQLVRTGNQLRIIVEKIEINNATIGRIEDKIDMYFVNKVEEERIKWDHADKSNVMKVQEVKN